MPRRRFNREFKVEVVKLAKERGVCCAELPVNWAFMVETTLCYYVP